MSCEHRSGGSDWLPMENGVMGKHPYCSDCGVVKNISSDKGRRIGYFMRSLSRLKNDLHKNGVKVSEAQIRLISNELGRADEFEDTWWMSFSRQKEIYVSVVQKYVGVTRGLIEANL
ncbi:MAG: hypothetical protein R6U44_02080 [Archaeoglobaceae archaeon]